MRVFRLKAVADLRGRLEARLLPPDGLKFFHFHAVFGKIIQVSTPTFGVAAPPLRKILDPPLQRIIIKILKIKPISVQKLE